MSMLSILTGNGSGKIIRKWSTKAPYVTGYDIESDVANSVTYGKVVYVGQELDGTFTVNVKCNDNEIFRYGNIISPYVKSAIMVYAGDKLGDVRKYVHFEYATRWQGDSTFPIRVNQFLYFKQDPKDIIASKYKPSDQAPIEYSPTRNKSMLAYMSDTQQYEFTGKKSVTDTEDSDADI